MADQEDVVAGERDMGGTMRLGLYPAALAEDSLVRELYGESVVQERHRHRYEVNNFYRDDLEKAGLRFSGLSPDGRLVEFIELPRDVHPYFVATQAHPELLSRPTRPHPLFSGLIEAAVARSRVGDGQRERGGRGARPPRPDRPPVTEIRDAAGRWPVTGSQVDARGRIVTLRTDRVQMPDGEIAVREVIEHPGAVAIVALDENGRVLMIRQYRHPAAATLWELPAGLRDVAGEPLVQTARRELMEEAGCRAATGGR